jgi:O-antigen ligase
VLLGLFQSLALPSPMLELFSSASARIYREAATTLQAFGHPFPAGRISIAPVETTDTLFLILAFAALFVSAALLLRTRERRRIFVWTLLVSALVHIALATTTHGFFESSDDPSSGRLHGAFVNANHFAGYLQIALAMAFAVLWREILSSRDRGRNLKERASRFESRLMNMILRVVLWAFIAAAIGLTKSRAGIVVAVLMTVVLLSLALSHPRARKGRWSLVIAGVSVFAAAAGYVFLTVQQQPIIRFLGSDPRDPDSDLRPTLWRLSVEAWKNFPVFGSGLGTFREAFRRIQPRSLDYLVEFAHSDSLQMLVTGGVVGLLLSGIAMGFLLVALLRLWRREQRREESAYILAAGGAIIALLLHGLVEFNFSIPAIPATLACVAGFGWAATRSELEAQDELRLVNLEAATPRAAAGQ